MTGDASKSKKLLAMDHSNKIAEVQYRFERHGVAKYFSKIHAAISKLRMLGAQKQDWEIFSTVFDHMSKQCMEFKQAVAEMRLKMDKDEDSVTLKYIETVFQREETIFKIGTSNKGTPIVKPVNMSAPPNNEQKVAAAKAEMKPGGGKDSKRPDSAK